MGSKTVADQDPLDQILRRVIPAGHVCGPIIVEETDYAEIQDAIARTLAVRAAKMPTDQAAIEQLNEAYRRLQDLGWKEAIYCPKDGSDFDVVEAGSTGIHPCFYMGKWPEGSFMIASHGDVYHSRPILFRLRAPDDAPPRTSPTPRDPLEPFARALCHLYSERSFNGPLDPDEPMLDGEPRWTKFRREAETLRDGLGLQGLIMDLRPRRDGGVSEVQP